MPYPNIGEVVVVEKPPVLKAGCSPEILAFSTGLSNEPQLLQTNLIMTHLFKPCCLNVSESPLHVLRGSL